MKLARSAGASKTVRRVCAACAQARTSPVRRVTCGAPPCAIARVMARRAP